LKSRRECHAERSVLGAAQDIEGGVHAFALHERGRVGTDRHGALRHRLVVVGQLLAEGELCRS